MLPRRFRRSPQRRLLRFSLYFVGALLVLDLLTTLKHYRGFSSQLESALYMSTATLPSPVRDQKIFIVATFWTNAWVIYSRWGAALISLVETLGPENVFLSIYESGSLDNTKEQLVYLNSRLEPLNVQRSIVLDPATHEDEIKAGPFDEHGNPRSGWVLPPGGKEGKEIRRIPYLARLRNLSLKPLLKEKAQGRTYDKILFLNDVVFRPSDVLSLLATNQGSYSAACALDFHYPARLATYYDTFALRDINGDSSLSVQYPYFRPSQSLDSILKGAATKVASCWNGMILMDAAPFYETSAPQDEEGVPKEVGLPFRAIPDSLASKHLEGSECCLIHADLNSSHPDHAGIYVNPAVRVGYTELAYNQTHFTTTTNPHLETFLTSTQYVLAVWFHRWNRLRTPSAEKMMRTITKRTERWKKDGENSLERRTEILGGGEMCLIDEMHLLIWNGWKHA